jgi:hypothetical protein
MDALFFLSNSEFFLAIRGGPYMTPFYVVSLCLNFVTQKPVKCSLTSEAICGAYFLSDEENASTHDVRV